MDTRANQSLESAEAKPCVSQSPGVPPTVPRLCANNCTPEEVCKQLQEWGCCVVEGLVSPDVVDEVRNDLQPYLESRKTYSEGGTVGIPGLKDFSGNKSKRVLGILGKSTASWKMAAHPLVEQVTEQMMLPFCDRVWLITSMLRSVYPGEGNQPLHQDRHSIPEMTIRPRPGYTNEQLTPGMQWGVASLWAISDSTVENGATRVVPGSHRWNLGVQDMDTSYIYGSTKGTSAGVAAEAVQETPAERAKKSAVHAPMKKGSVLFYLGGVIHGGSQNTSDDSRRDLILLHYGPAWIRQEENMFLTIPRSIAQKMPSKLQKLIGYTLHGQTLGMADVNGDYGDPQEWLAQWRAANEVIADTQQ